jgi:hypothetical protein
MVVLAVFFHVPSAEAQTITVVGTPHLRGLDAPPTADQLAHTVEALSAFEPTQVCVERMSGERIQVLAADPEQHGMTLRPETASRPIATVIVPLGIQMQARLERGPKQARMEASGLIDRWDALETEERIRAIALQVAGYEFHSAVLNWAWLDDRERGRATDTLPGRVVEAMQERLESIDEVYALGVPLARKAGLHELCTADSQEDESRGMAAAMAHGGQPVIDRPDVADRLDQLRAYWDEAWRPDNGPAALASLLRQVNGEAFAEVDRRLQWETLRQFDNDDGAFRRRLMYWHARTAEISAELFRALARGPEERVMLIIGSAHRSFTEADLRAQPWVDVVSARSFLETDSSKDIP